MDTNHAPQTSMPSPEETLALTRELVARSRSRLRDIDRRLSERSGAEAPPPNGDDATV